MRLGLLVGTSSSRPLLKNRREGRTYTRTAAPSPSPRRQGPTSRGPPRMPRVPPPEVIASWPSPSPNPETRGPAKTIATVLLWALVVAVLLLRLYTRRYVTRCVGRDDILVTAAFVPGTAFSIVGIVAEYEFGWDRHIWDLSVEQITKGLQLRYDLTTRLIFSRLTLRCEPLDWRASPSSTSQQPSQNSLSWL